MKWWYWFFSFSAAKRLLFCGVSFLRCCATCCSTLGVGFLCHGGFLILLLVAARCGSRHPRRSVGAALQHYGNEHELEEARWKVGNEQQVSEWMHEGDGWQIFIFPRSSAVWCPCRVTRGTRLHGVVHQLHPRRVAGARAVLPWQGRGLALSCTRLFSAVFACYFIAWWDLL